MELEKQLSEQDIAGKQREQEIQMKLDEQIKLTEESENRVVEILLKVCI